MREHRNVTLALRACWYGMRSRCLKPHFRDYRHYGGRGIGIWPPWVDSFKTFEHDVEAAIGPHPGKDYTLDRIDNDKGYVPGNLRWATWSQQMKNRRRPHP